MQKPLEQSGGFFISQLGDQLKEFFFGSCAAT